MNTTGVRPEELASSTSCSSSSPIVVIVDLLLSGPRSFSPAEFKLCRSNQSCRVPPRLDRNPHRKS
jgi:hypothetical protein